ncbi:MULTISPECIES: SbtR family transcriptional regulator [Nocardiaceae]|uniref:SbtR family transcriptional regulator n=1 Tax=Nocardiaceae TaxID=85025 RepID=UPI000A8F9AB8
MSALAAAQRSGDIRPDLTPTELFDLLSAAAWLRERSDREQSDRILGLVLEGLTRR